MLELILLNNNNDDDDDDVVSKRERLGVGDRAVVLLHSLLDNIRNANHYIYWILVIVNEILCRVRLGL